ncbi:hypothetical protein DOY81_015264, partial [Sarcophaga bullata]
PARRKSVLAPILSKIKNGTDAISGSGIGGGDGGVGGGGGTGSDTEKKSNGTDSTGHISVQIEPAKRVKQILPFRLCFRYKRHSIHGMMEGGELHTTSSGNTAINLWRRRNSWLGCRAVRYGRATNDRMCKRLKTPD